MRDLILDALIVCHNDQCRPAIRCLLLQQMQHLPTMPVIQGTGGFISQKDIRPIDQGPGNGYPLLLALTAMPGVSVEAMKQTKLVQKCVNSEQIDFLSGQPLGQGNILFDIQGLQEMRRLKDQADMLPAKLVALYPRH